MLRRSFPCLLVVLALTAVPTAAAAQLPSHVSPLGATSDLGNDGNLIPFASTPTAYQQVHDLASFGNATAKTFTRMRLRPGRGFRNQPGRLIDVELWMADSPVDNTMAAAAFAANVDIGTEVAVFSRKLVNLPVVPDNSWSVAFPFDLPFGFTGQRHLSWRAIVWGNDNANASFPYPLDAWAWFGTSTTNGPSTGCRSSNGTADAVHTASVQRPGLASTFDANSYVAGKSLPAVLSIGTSASVWAGLPLPVDLTPLGAPGCSLRNDVLLMVRGTTASDVYGSISVNVTFPFNRALFGAPFFTQFLFLEPGANALGAFTSNGLAHTLGLDHGVARIYAAGNPQATSGTSRALYYGLAIGLD